ncbi:hypothetical protein [Leptolyngbya sp. 7M]|uniref:hypothetical protein n=1 Tax=Leptolyngbya sp. 7M TaxID=2812896 RepID=UPI001B8C3E8B|nr:hypothetical protein [Leptolyngbya sp. 7M]QYO68320.1 hypothetical protein JVX88_17055 [Leptolyngbya sp. 7M]
MYSWWESSAEGTERGLCRNFLRAIIFGVDILSRRATPFARPNALPGIAGFGSSKPHFIETRQLGIVNPDIVV